MSKKAPLKNAIEAVEHVVEDATDFVYEKWHQRFHRKARAHVHKLRQRPDHHKKAIAFTVAFTVTLIVFIFWYFFSIPRIFREYQVIRDQNERLDIEENPFKEFQEKYSARKNAAEASAPIEVE